MRGMSYIIEPDAGHRSYRVGGVVTPGGRRIRVGGFRDQRSTERLRQRLDALSAAAIQGDAPPPELASWLASMPETMARTLTKAGLIQRRHREQGRPLASHIEDYQQAVKARRNNTQHHAKAMADRVRAVVGGIKAESYSDITQHDVEVWVSGQGWSPAYQRAHLVAAKDFCGWMVRDKRAGDNPLSVVKLPTPVEEFDRRPFTREEIGRLLAHLGGFDYYPGQSKGSRAEDRRMVYWTAACTGLRRTELTRVKRYQLRLGEDPSIEVAGRNTKNDAPAVIPIPRDLAVELDRYTSLMSPSARVFKVPSAGRKRSKNAKGEPVLTWLHRDLKAAGLGHLLELGEDIHVDFHALRATAIVWWSLLGYSDLEVKRFARLKTPGMVAKYRRNFGQPGRSRLDAGPPLVPQLRHAGFAGA